MKCFIVKYWRFFEALLEGDVDINRCFNKQLETTWATVTPLELSCESNDEEFAVIDFFKLKRRIT